MTVSRQQGHELSNVYAEKAYSVTYYVTCLKKSDGISHQGGLLQFFFERGLTSDYQSSKAPSFLHVTANLRVSLGILNCSDLTL